MNKIKEATARYQLKQEDIYGFIILLHKLFLASSLVSKYEVANNV